VRVAVRPPSTEVAVTTAVPAATAVTTPAASTVATVGALDDHVTAWWAAAGATAATSVAVVPTVRAVVRGAAFIVTPVGMAVMLIESAAEGTPPAVAVMLTVPTLTPETTPAALTVAIAGLFGVQVTAGLVAFAGRTVAVRVLVVPTRTKLFGATRGAIVTVATGTTAAVTVIKAAPTGPSTEVALIMAVPAATAVTSPAASTVAISGSLEDQDIVG